jgi:hypothetical protein
MAEVLVESLYSCRTHSLSYQIPDRVVDQSTDDPRREAETVRKVRRDVELRPTDVDGAFARLAERDHTRVKSVHESTESEKVERGVCLGTYCGHSVVLSEE